MRNFIENPLAFASRMVTFYYEATGSNGLVFKSSSDRKKDSRSHVRG